MTYSTKNHKNHNERAWGKGIGWLLLCSLSVCLKCGWERINPFDPQNIREAGHPITLKGESRIGAAHLSWNEPKFESPDGPKGVFEYIILRKLDGSANQFEPVDTVKTLHFDDSTSVPFVPYQYQVALMVDKQTSEPTRSEVLFRYALPRKQLCQIEQYSPQALHWTGYQGIISFINEQPSSISLLRFVDINNVGVDQNKCAPMASSVSLGNSPGNIATQESTGLLFVLVNSGKAFKIVNSQLRAEVTSSPISLVRSASFLAVSRDTLLFAAVSSTAAIDVYKIDLRSSPIALRRDTIFTNLKLNKLLVDEDRREVIGAAAFPGRRIGFWDIRTRQKREETPELPEQIQNLEFDSTFDSLWVTCIGKDAVYGIDIQMPKSYAPIFQFDRVVDAMAVFRSGEAANLALFVLGKKIELRHAKRREKLGILEASEGSFKKLATVPPAGRFAVIEIASLNYLRLYADQYDKP